MSTSPKPLTPRSALILLLALITAIATGSLLYQAIQLTALSIITGGAAFAASWRFYDEIIT